MSEKFTEYGVKIKIDDTRAVGEDPGQILEAMSEVWDELQEKLDGMPEKKKEKLLEHFNSVIEGEDDLGDILFGADFASFEKRIKTLDGDNQQKYTDDLQEMEILQKDSENN